MQNYRLSDSDVDWVVYLLGVAAEAARGPVSRRKGQAEADNPRVVSAAEMAALRLAGEFRDQQKRGVIPA